MTINRPRISTLASHRLIGVLLIGFAAQLTSCARPATPSASASDNSSDALLVSAAASTKDALEAVNKMFHMKSRAEVKFNIGPSNVLANQIISGAPADLFLSANEQWADEVEKAGLAEMKVRLLTNKLVL